MKAIDILNYIPKERLKFLASKTNVDYKAKKLDGIVFFQLFLYSLLSVKRTSLRVMEQVFSSYTFQEIAGANTAKTIKYNSLSDRFNTINPDFFEALFEECCSRFKKHFKDDKANIIRFDSTHVAISSKLIDYGFRLGSKNNHKNQLKFTIGLSNIPVHGSFFHEKSYNSENRALKEAILETADSKEKIVVFDRGIHSRNTFEEFDQQSILFVSRLQKRSRYKIVEQYSIPTTNESEELVIEKDYKVLLYNKTDKPIHSPFRLIIAQSKKMNEPLLFITNIEDMSAREIAEVYKQRWEIEVFFKFLKQELNFNNLISRSLNGIKVVLYLTLIMAILLTVYKKLNKIKGYKIPRLKFAQELEANILEQIVIICGGDPSKIPKL